MSSEAPKERRRMPTVAPQCEGGNYAPIKDTTESKNNGLRGTIAVVDWLYMGITEKMITCKDNLGSLVTLPKKRFRERRSVYGFIKSESGICICRTISSGKVWFPGGEIEEGENEITALKREIKEETGLMDVLVGNHLRSFDSFFFFQPTNEAMHSNLSFYACSSPTVDFPKQSILIDSEEKELEWIEPGSLKENDFPNLNQELVSLLQAL